MTSSYTVLQIRRRLCRFYISSHLISSDLHQSAPGCLVLLRYIMTGLSFAISNSLSQISFTHAMKGCVFRIGFCYDIMELMFPCWCCCGFRTTGVATQSNWKHSRICCLLMLLRRVRCVLQTCARDCDAFCKCMPLVADANRASAALHHINRQCSQQWRLHMQ